MVEIEQDHLGLEAVKAAWKSGYRCGVACSRYGRTAWAAGILALLTALGAVVGMGYAVREERAALAERERDLLDRELHEAGGLVAIVRWADHERLLARLAREQAERAARAAEDHAVRIGAKAVPEMVLKRGR